MSVAKQEQAKTEESSTGQPQEAHTDDDDSLAKQLQARAPRIITHLNHHHPDSVQAYALAFGTPALPASLKIGTCQITKVDLYGFTIQVTTDGIQRDSWYVFCPFSRPLQAATEVHAISIEMHIQAYDKLGYAYKIQHGYYSRMMHMIGSKVVQTTKKNLFFASSSTTSSLWTRHRLLSVAACTGLLLAASAWLWHHSWSSSSSKTSTRTMSLLSPAREQQQPQSTAAAPAGPIGIPKRPVYIERP